ncbi:hypothetical protein COU61_04620 [Candidatus Pacearchaeota archaeon CG10_big_fil_rev_8_21_14_0_10_35_13]|nr:MAG: hypothetical protein COU61_04620 [Candidatus Pacearchaeota archaeon CG10_big_fil_rev_8_21_14_0_10_35_13]
MILKILGTLDIVTAILFWIYGMFEVIAIEKTVLILGIILLLKGAAFIAGGINVLSLLDIISASIIIIALFMKMPALIVALVALFLLQKGVMSLISKG